MGFILANRLFITPVTTSLKQNSRIFVYSAAASTRYISITKVCVIGAGPAGIAAIGLLLDNGIKPQNIIWIDPCFQVGMLGKRWSSVSSNTKASLFTDFLNASPSFDYEKISKNYTRFPLQSLNGEETCELKYVVDPLQAVTNNLLHSIPHLQDNVIKIQRVMNAGSSLWLLRTEKDQEITANLVILASGSTPKEIQTSIPTIPLEEAMQIEKLKAACSPSDTVAVFGSSHSAIMIIRDLCELGVKKVVNFYRSPILYAEYLPGGGIKNDSTGLKGKTRTWALNNFDSKGQSLIPKLTRFESTKEMTDAHLPNCDKAIYAIGFEKRQVEIEGNPGLKYDCKTGKVADGIYGCGIAFPELAPDAVGKLEHQVGLWKFMKYMKRMVPIWID